MSEKQRDNILLLPDDFEKSTWNEAVEESLLDELNGCVKQFWPRCGYIIVAGNRYWNDGYWSEFDDPDQSEDPRLYRTLRNARKTAKSLETLDYDDQSVCAFWVHPDADVVPVEKYVKMTKGRFPGSPRK